MRITKALPKIGSVETWMPVLGAAYSLRDEVFIFFTRWLFTPHDKDVEIMHSALRLHKNFAIVGRRTKYSSTRSRCGSIS